MEPTPFNIETSKIKTNSSQFKIKVIPNPKLSYWYVYWKCVLNRHWTSIIKILVRCSNFLTRDTEKSDCYIIYIQSWQGTWRPKAYNILVCIYHSQSLWLLVTILNVGSLKILQFNILWEINMLYEIESQST